MNSPRSRTQSKSFPRFSSDTLTFIEKASRQKHPLWLDKNRAEYEAVLLEPLRALASRLKSGLAAVAPNYHFPQKGIGRIKRSASHPSESGSLYKNWINYSASRPRTSRFERNPSLYFGLHPDDEDGDHVIVAGGLYMPSSSQLRAVREAVASGAAPQFDRLFATKAFRSKFKGGFSDERISSRVPRGFDPAHPRLKWIQLQAFFVWRAYSKKEFASPEFSKIVLSDWQQILKLNELLDQAVQGRLTRAMPERHPGRKHANTPGQLSSRLEELDVIIQRPDFD